MPKAGARSIALLFLAGSLPAFAGDAADLRPCLRTGEVFTFVVKALGMKGGHLRISTVRDAAEVDRIRVEASMATEGFARSVYKYNNDSISIIDPATGKLLQTQSRGLDGSKSFDRVTDLNHATNELVHVDRIRPKKSYRVALPAALIDLSGTMVCARLWNLRVGESRDVMLTYEGEVYELSVKALREENVSTPLGKFKTLVLEPSQRGEPKGAFKKGTAFRMYLTQESPPRLVRFDSMASAVTLVALLERVDEGQPVVATP